MITLAILNALLSITYSLAVHIFGNLIEPFTALSSYIQAFYVPQTLLDIFALVNTFLPIGTVTVLLGFTGLIVGFKIICSVIHFLPGLITG